MKKMTKLSLQMKMVISTILILTMAVLVLPKKNVFASEKENSFYKVEFYEQQDDGSYVINDLQTIMLNAYVGDEVSYDAAKTSDSLTLNTEKSVLSGVVTKMDFDESGNLSIFTLKVYYDTEKKDTVKPEIKYLFDTLPVYEAGKTASFDIKIIEESEYSVDFSKVTISANAQMDVTGVEDGLYNVEYTLSEAGKYVITFEPGFVKDKYGNVNDKKTVELEAVVLDKISPTIEFTGDNKNITAGDTKKFILKVNDESEFSTDLTKLTSISNENFEVVDAYEKVDNEYVVSIKFLKAGEYSFNIPEGFATDKSGNTSVKTEVKFAVKELVKLDTTKPVVQVIGGKDKVYVGNTASLFITVTDDSPLLLNMDKIKICGSKKFISVTKKFVSENQVKVTITFNKQGSYQIVAEEGFATDTNGNVNLITESKIKVEKCKSNCCKKNKFKNHCCYTKKHDRY